jgi:RNA polymerase sigma factor (sigma-70 family)
MMNDDMALVREYATRNSEVAFATLVSLHVGLVHSAALRQMGDPHVAEEITQTVFILLARKAGSLDTKTILPGWLYRTANYVSAAALKMQRRRAQREQEAYMQSLLQDVQTDSSWEQLAPLLDGAMAQLRGSDRDALVLRYFQNKHFKEVGDALGVEECTARKRVERALEKLRTLLAKRGIALTVTIIAGAVSANSVRAVPVAVANSVTAVAVAKGATASGSTLILIKGALKIMAWTKAKIAGAVVVGVLLATGATTAIVFRHEIGYRFALAGGRRAVANHVAEPLDLTGHYGSSASVFNSGPEYWGTVPSGFQVFDHVPLQIGGLLCLWGERNAAGGAKFPEQVVGIPVNRKFEALYIYQTAFFPSSENTPVYEVVWRYEDGSSATNQLRYGSDIIELAGNPTRRASRVTGPNNKTANDPTGPNSSLAWMGGTRTQGQNRPMRFCLTAIANPQPAVEVTSIDLYSCKSESAPCILAMTTGRAALMK